MRRTLRRRTLGFLVMSLSLLLPFASSGAASVTANATYYEGVTGTTSICSGCVATVSVVTWVTAYTAPTVVSVIAGNGCANYSVYNRYDSSGFGLWVANSDIAMQSGHSCSAQWQMGMVNGA